MSVISAKPTNGKLYSVVKENYINYLLTRDTFLKLQYRGKKGPQELMGELATYLQLAHIKDYAKNWQATAYVASRPAVQLHPNGPMTGVFGGQSAMFADVPAYFSIRNGLSPTIYIPTRNLEVPILKSILMYFMSSLVKLNNDSVYTFRVSLLNLQMRYKMRKDLIDTEHMDTNILIEEISG